MSATPGHMHGATAAPSGGADMDALAEAVVKRFPEQTRLVGNQPLAPRLQGGVKVFELTSSAFEWQIDAIKEPVNAVGYNGTWPGPLLRVTEGDRVRIVHRNDLDESTGMHFHGQNVPNAMDGVPFLTQPPIRPGETFTYEFVAGPSGSHMYHSHHNATDQVGRGMLGTFIVDPRDVSQRYQVDQDIVWISNDALGGFTINGKGFPATAPIVATVGQQVLIRFMNEGVMMHPWHLHGMPMRVVARDGYPLGGAAFTCDTLGVNPGERWDVIVDCNNPGVWAFHCHILTHAEGHSGMFGMVTALIVEA
jgi:FtsP/CotA-like multicopper oxidase with cupredoxin domain